MSGDYPDIKKGTRWPDTHARQWANLTEDVRGPATILAGPGILVRRMGEHLNLSVWPSILQLLTRRRPGRTTGTGVIDTFEVMVKGDPAFAEDDEQPMHDDWFYARQLSTGDTRIKIAKPHKLRKTPWNEKSVKLDAYDVRVEYSYFPNSLTLNQSFKRHVTRADEPNVRQKQIIWPEYVVFFDAARANPLRSEDFILAAQIGEEATQIDGVEWQDLNDSSRDWSVLPQEFVNEDA